MKPTVETKIKKTAEKSQETPTIKCIKTQQPIKTTVWPRSGCMVSKNTQRAIEKKDKVNPALGLLCMLPATIQDTKTTKNGFKYSDGWIVNQFNENHRTAPFPKSVPKIGRSASAITAQKKPVIPNLRTTDRFVEDKKTIRENEIML